uniref:Uncharacterized protein n=1 Tax=Solanum tuberosum TaxID=4113 RepID=M0ZPV4_SOLTU
MITKIELPQYFCLVVERLQLSICSRRFFNYLREACLRVSKPSKFHFGFLMNIMF